MWRGGLGGAQRCPPLSSAGASFAPPCSVSTSRSSNRTCPIKASGSPTGFTSRPTGTPDSAPFVGPYSSFRDRPAVGFGVARPCGQSPGCWSLPQRTRSQVPSLHRLLGRLPDVVRRLLRYYGPVRLPRPCIAQSGHCRPLQARSAFFSRRVVGSPGSRATSFHTCEVLRPRRAVRALALMRPSVLPSAFATASAPGYESLRGSMVGLCAPLPTLRRHPRECQRTAQGRCGSLLLHRGGLSPPTPYRSSRRTESLHFCTMQPSHLTAAEPDSLRPSFHTVCLIQNAASFCRCYHD